MTAPLASVVVPAWRSERTIAECLDGLRAQRFRGFEVVVVNSSPGDATATLVRRRLPEAVYVESRDRLLPHAARNLGAARARGDLLVFTDPDCRPRPDWLERLVEARRSGRHVVVGAMGLRQGGRLARGIHLVKFHALLDGAAPGPRWIAPTANAAYSREAWAAAGPFAGDVYAGDALLSWRAAARFGRPWLEPRAVVEHRHAETVPCLLRQRMSRGREFAAARCRQEGWSRRRTLAHLAATPLLPALVLARAARDAAASGWGAAFAATLPLQLAGQAAWQLGEARTHLRLALGAGAGPTGGPLSPS